MKNKKLVIVVAVAALIAGFMFIKGSNVFKPRAAKKIVTAGQVLPVKAPVKKAISKDMGGLTVKVQGSNKMDMNLKISTYRVMDKKSSVYAASSVSSRMQELSPGLYDIQIETTPPMIYKGIQVSMGKETIEDLGTVTGAINVKLLNAKKKDAFLPFKVLYQKSAAVSASGTTNKAVELLPGKYDLDIGTLPRQTKKDVVVTAGREALIDFGFVMGTLTVSAVDENNKAVRLNARIKKADTGEVVTSIATNRPVEILKGAYIVELLSSPIQTKKDIIIEAGSELAAEFIVKVPAPMPAKVQVPVKAVVKK